MPFKPNLSLYDLHEIIGSALRRASKILEKHQVALQLAAEMLMVEIDAVLFEQAIFNILDNASKYAPDDTNIQVQRRIEQNSVCIELRDEREGIPSADVEHIFDKFHRVEKGDQVRAGTGLGLAIARGFVEAMHGITAANRADRSGAVLQSNFQFRF